MRKSKTYTVYFRVKLDTDMEISATSLEQAIEKAKEYGVVDVIEFQGEHIDSEIVVSGVFSPSE